METKKVLGTAQFDNNQYGVANFSKKKNNNQLISVLNFAYEKGIKYFDTAPSYNSENILGQFIKKNKIQNEIKIITKIPKLVLEKKNFTSQIEDSIKRSIDALNTDKIYCILMHNQFDINNIKSINCIENLKKKFKIKNFGFSVYDLNVAKNILNFFPSASLQFPFNLINYKFLKLKKENNLFFGRSIFSQGFLVKNKLKKINPKLIKLHKKYYKLLTNLNIDPVELCLDYAYSNKNLDFLVFGITSIKELKKIVNYKPDKQLNSFAISKIRMIFKKHEVDPRYWYLK